MASQRPTRQSEGKFAVARTPRGGEHADSLVRAGLSLDLLLGFAPFVAFLGLMRLSVSFALWAAFAAAFTLSLPAFLKTRRLRTLDAGSLVLFGVLALFAGFIPPVATLGAVRFMVDLGLLVTALISLWWGEPFTLQYAHENARDDRPSSPDFVQLHWRISAAWAAGFAAMAAADAAAIFVSGMPDTVSAAFGLAGLLGALTFTLRYPAYARRRSR